MLHPAARHADINFNQNRQAHAGGFGGGFNQRDLRGVIHAHRDFSDARKGRKPRQFARADHLVGDQNIRNAAPGERFCLGHLLHALANRAARHLQLGDDAGFMGFRMRAKLGTGGRQQRRHGVKVMFECIQINHQRGGINILLTHAGFGGRVLQHGAGSFVAAHSSHAHAFRANPPRNIFAMRKKRWSGREDSNLRPPVPKTGALARLRHAPNAAHPMGSGALGQVLFCRQYRNPGWRRAASAEN